ncbi:hypothetical protein ACFYWN_19150 [Streptomyces sp. NPDC002917]|uniref:hypothetical protein n=1 Tax=unclassified Streptomyces TaxID=2593676 RepID=UPI002E823CC8|nr:hypothetical protein [Streptomyces sp. NBC_00562]WUC25818.1 hypothetical protein OHA33_37350 [Streptomyces sp. NBC_00562]
MGCLAFLLAVLTGTAETEYFGYLYEVLKPTAHRFATADQILGTACTVDFDTPKQGGNARQEQPLTST